MAIKALVFASACTVLASVNPAAAAPATLLGIYMEGPLSQQCNTKGNCFIYFSQVLKPTVVEQVSCSLRIFYANNTYVGNAVLAKASGDKSRFVDQVYLDVPHAFWYDDTSQGINILNNTKWVIPDNWRPALRFNVTSDVTNVTFSASCSISGKQG
jgi:hypothetical protein